MRYRGHTCSHLYTDLHVNRLLQRCLLFFVFINLQFGFILPCSVALPATATAAASLFMIIRFKRNCCSSLIATLQNHFYTAIPSHGNPCYDLLSSLGWLFLTIWRLTLTYFHCTIRVSVLSFSCVRLAYLSVCLRMRLRCR